MKKPIRLLLVEDSEDDALLLLRELSKAGFVAQHRRVEDADEMRAALLGEEWDVVVADYVLPEFDGLAALGLLQDTGIDIPFILVSGKVGEEIAVEAMRAGAHDYIMKSNLTRLAPAIDRELREADIRRQHRQATQALEDSERRYRLLAENAADVIWMADEDLDLSYVSPSVYRLRGYTEEETLGQPLDQVLTSSSYTMVERILQVYLAEVRAGRPAAPIDIEFEVTRRDAGPVHVESRIMAGFDADNQSAHVIGVTRDISERKRMESELRRSEASLREAQRLAKVGSWEWDAATNLIRCSEEVHRIFGLPPFEPVEPDQFLSMVPARSRTSLTEQVKESVKNRTGYGMDFRITRRDGTERVVHAQGEARFDLDGNLTGLVGTVHDITEQKRAEAALRSLTRRLLEVQEEERREIARELHDETGQNLTVLKLLLTRLGRFLLDGEAVGTLEEAKQITNKIVADVRALSLSLRPGMLDALGLLPTLEWYFRDFTHRTNIRVHFRHTGVDRELPPDLTIAAFRIIQESLTNVVKHAQVDSVSVHITVQDDQLTVDVSDNGRGFDPSRLPATSAGLMGIRERARLLDGAATIESAPGKGTRVRAVLPVTGNRLEDKALAGIVEESDAGQNDTR